MHTRQVHKHKQTGSREKTSIDLGAISRRIREIGGFELTQGEFARSLGIGRTQLSRYELGQSAPTLEILVKLRAYSGKSIDWILTGEEPGEKR
jgi:transcriptional regulator with XRE-family HTH domain